MLTIKKFIFYFLSSFLLLFSACKKEPLIGALDYKTLGTSAHDLLSATDYSSLQIEINYMPGQQLDATSLTGLQSFLITYINKPGGIQITQKQIAASGKVSLLLNEVVSIEKTNRTGYTQNGVMAVHILITDGAFANTNTFATSYWNTSYSLFGKTINNNSGGVGQVTRARLITTLLQHEFGHLLGLVGQGTPMQINHKDAANGAHCNVTNCLMNYSVETSNIIAGTAIPLLDANCVSDLKANGGK